MALTQLAALDGQVRPAEELRIPVTDKGLVRGDGVFEVVRVYEGRPFAFDDHLERMRRSADNLRLPLDAGALRADYEAVAAAAPEHDGIVRMMVTRGGRGIVLHEPLPEYPPVMRLATITYAPTRILDGIK